MKGPRAERSLLAGNVNFGELQGFRGFQGGPLEGRGRAQLVLISSQRDLLMLDCLAVLTVQLHLMWR